MNIRPTTIRRKYMKKRMPFFARALALTLAFTVLFQAVEPTVSYALTSGPSQPEAAQFQPVGVTDMVDVFTGDFGYNIPLLELPGPNGGYPFNLSYQSGITMDQEASWVGLGWNVNAGAIVRNMRGLPDEFNGKSDKVIREVDMKPNETYGAKTAITIELAGGDASVGTGTSTGISVGVNIYENSYRGIGYGFDVGTSFGSNNDNSMNAGVGLNLSLDAQEGVGANVDAHVSSKGHKDKKGRTQKENLGLGIGFHSSGGLNGSISGSISAYEAAGKDKKGRNRIEGNGINGSSSISFAVPSYTPTIGMEMRSKNFTGHFSIGPASNAVFPKSSVDGYYTLSKVAKSREELPAYGYLNLQNQTDKEDHAMLDFNREKDGVVYKKSKNLASPSLTYDFYVINGQGAGGMFRPYRQEYGHIHEQGRFSEGAGGAFGFDVGIPGHYGISGSFNYSSSRSGDWDEGNDAKDFFGFMGKQYRNSTKDNHNGHTYEGAYFKLAGEKAAIPGDELDAIFKEAPVALKNSGHQLTDQLYSPGTSPAVPATTLAGNNMRRDKRMPRAVAIVAYTNEQLMDRIFQGTTPQRNNELLGEYDIQVYPKFNNGQIITKASLGALTEYHTEIPLARGVNSSKEMVHGNHLAGHTVVQPDGKRYVYGLPAYNHKQVQETFSVPVQDGSKSTIDYTLDSDGPAYKHSAITDEYHERVEIPRYAHSYLLTAVLGDDYVDADNIPGPSQGDFGYWVKFNYVQTSSNYKWRTPYRGASYLPGSDGSSVDDKASFTYGEKEIWYLASAETQTHILYFEMSPRGDGLGANGENPNLVNTPSVDAINRLYKLDKIKLYSKAELAAEPLDEPLQTVHFEYSYGLCPGTANSIAASGSGKLTLRKVYFTHKNDRSGMLSPYIFNYDFTGNNPSYDVLHNKYDRWGTYRSFTYGTDRVNQEFPYTPQFNPAQQQTQANRDAFKAQTDKDASAWHLTSVQLPSGGTIKIEYESDDYAYVQHKKATQMFRLASVGNPPGSGTQNELFDDGDDFWGNGYSPGNSTDVTNSLEARKVYFRLEKPIQSIYSPEQARQQLLENYLDCLLDKEANTYTKPLYAKMKVNLRGTINDYISGYFFAQLDGNGKPLCGVVDNPVTIDGVSSYEYGYLVLDFAKVDGNPVYYHPFAVAAWQYLRINLPRVLTGSGDFVSGADNSDMEHLTRMASLGSWINTIQSMFTGYRKYCFEKEFAKTITLDQSFIRLNSPDGIKYGGGSRVKKLYVEDDPVWGNDKIGQVYDYTLTPERGKPAISSGVASYEPIIGGEENALRTAKIYTQDIPFFTDNNLFFELPVNESYYPAPRVGYSRVTVTSLATHEVQQKIAQGAAPETYAGILTTGRTVHEFYTAKDFPVIARETDMTPFGEPILVPLPFIGMVQVSKLTASQGYSIELNDMHGKSRSVATYGSKKEGGFTDDPITRVQYIYNTENISHEGEPALRLKNEVYVLKDDPQMLGNSNQPSVTGDKAITELMYVGYEYDFFADFRKSVDESGSGGLSFNMDIMGGGPVQFPLPFPWPSFNFSHLSTRLAVTNKIINRSGILMETVATDGQSTVRTQNLVFDKYTGEPLVTTVNNNYDNKIYNYQYPAHLAYNGTGAAYENILMEFTATPLPLPGRGWTIKKDDPSATPVPSYTIGSNPGMGVILSEIATASNHIPYEQLYDYLQEGDEFIVEFLKNSSEGSLYIPGSKHIATLTEKRIGTSYLNCQDDKQLIFNWNDSSMAWKAYPVRMLLVRSGKRNLLNLKTGAIKTLLEPGAGGSLLTNSPLYNREKETALSSVQPNLYEALTRQTAEFLNQILDCNGQFPVGTYYLDEARFLKNDGALKYPELFGLLKSINVFDNCGKDRYCFASSAGPDEFQIRCHAECRKTTYPDIVDDYTQGTVSCDNPFDYADEGIRNYINSWIQTQQNNGLTNQQIVNSWNDSERLIPRVFPPSTVPAIPKCYELYYGPTYTCDKNSCHDCQAVLGVDQENKNIYPGYHLVFKFREEFASYVDNGCITAHCLATAKYKNGSNILRTFINNVKYLSPGNLQVNYNAFPDPANNNTNTTQTEFCFASYSFQVPSTYYKIKNVLAASAVELTPYKVNEEMYKNKKCEWKNGELITSYDVPLRNLYQGGYKGIWRAAKTYYYADERYQGTKPTNNDPMTSMLDLATDGVFDGTVKGSIPDKMFYLFNWNSFLAKKIHPKWLANETVTSFTRNSQSAEARDVLGLYSAVKFDKNRYLPVAVGRNMRANKMIYENFDNTNEIAWSNTDNFDQGGIPSIDTAQVEKIQMPFTGNYCLSVKPSVRYIFPRTQFAPDPGEKYIVSMWAGGYNTLYSPEQIAEKFWGVMDVVVFFIDENWGVVGTPVVVRGKGKIMEGKAGFWRRMEETVTVPPVHNLRMALWFNSGYEYTYPGGEYGTMYQMLSPNGSVFLDQRACYDDIRIYPADGLMQTYVYDPHNYRLAAEGDENNYPTYYGYAPSGALMVVKKLTEEGIKTLKEIRANTKRGPYTEPYTNPDTPQGGENE